MLVGVCPVLKWIFRDMSTAEFFFFYNYVMSNLNSFGFTIWLHVNKKKNVVYNGVGTLESCILGVKGNSLTACCNSFSGSEIFLSEIIYTQVIRWIFNSRDWPKTIGSIINKDLRGSK